MDLLASLALELARASGPDEAAVALREQMDDLLDVESAWLVLPDAKRGGLFSWGLSRGDHPGRNSIEGVQRQTGWPSSLGLRRCDDWKEYPIPLKGTPGVLLLLPREGNEVSEGGISALLAGLITLAAHHFSEAGILSRGKAEWEKAFDAAGDLFYFHDASGLIFRANMAVSAFTGLPIREIIGNRCATLFPGLCAGVDSSGAEWVMPGSRRVFQVSAQTVNLEGDPSILHVLHEVTLQRELDEMVREQRQIELTRKLLQGVAHEIRNPLFGISTVVQALQKKLGSTAEAGPYSEYILAEVNRLDRLIHRFMLLAAPEDDTHHRPGLALDDVIQDSVALVCERWPDLDLSRVRVAVPERDFRMKGDGAALAWAFSELLENALAFGPPGTIVDVVIREVGAGAGAGAGAEISIRDHGPGLPPEAASALFEPFFTTRAGHVGLGLTVAKANFVHHGGSIVAQECSPPPGVRFSVRLPLE